MTRGKYSQRAEKRRDEQSTSEEIAAYRRNILRLTNERNDAREELARFKAQAESTLRRLTAERDEGTSAALQAAHHELRQAKEKIRQQNSQGKDFADFVANLRTGIVRYLRSTYGMTRGEAVQVSEALIRRAVDRDDKKRAVVPEPSFDKLSDEAKNSLRVARSR